MDFYSALFWIGLFVSIASHTFISQQHTVVALVGTACMFVGSKLGREFLGIV
jgi:hypothetical protein